MRQFKEKFPNFKIIHRSFALIREPKDFDNMFGSREEAKNEILEHWRHANKNDDLRRFNIEGMKKQTFLFPTSMNALHACKAAALVAGEDGYWDAFDALQNALFVENKNIENQEIIDSVMKTLSFDFDSWRGYYSSDKVKKGVLDDFSIARKYGINSVPTLVVNEKNIIPGAQSLDKIIENVGAI